MRLSIIIPAYNVELYLKKCIDSILPQIGEEDEIILVNPASTDKTQQILEEYAKQNSHIHYYTIERAGPSKTRNIGIQKAKGKYILFLDADDYIEENYIERMLEERKDHELVICSYRMIQEETGETQIKQYSQKKEEISFDKIPVLYEKELLNLVWNKIYETSIIQENHITFNEKYTKGEDLLFNLAYIQKVNSIKVIPDILYNYIRKKTGVSRSYIEPIENRIERTKMIYEEMIKASRDENVSQIKKTVINLYFHHLRNYIKEQKIYAPWKITRTFREKIKIDYLLQDNLDESLQKIKKLYEKKHIVMMCIKNKMILRKEK